jgi:F0F1-type ATP synthase alpha subunit
VIVLLAATEGYLDAIALQDVSAFESGLLLYFESRHADLCHRIDRTGELDDTTREVLMGVIARSVRAYCEAWTEEEDRLRAVPGE